MWKGAWLIVIVVGVYIGVRYSTPKISSPTKSVNASYDYIIGNYWYLLDIIKCVDKYVESFVLITVLITDIDSFRR